MAATAVSVGLAYYQSQQSKKQGNAQMSEAMNPIQNSYLYPYMEKYAGQLDELMKNPSTITTNPGYQFNLDQGLQGVSRNMASMGLANSGNAMIGLNNYAENYAQNAYQQQVQNLMHLAGYDQGPVQTNMAGYNAGLQTKQAGMGQMANGLGLAAGAASNYYGNYAGNSTAYSNYYGNAGAYNNIMTNLF